MKKMILLDGRKLNLIFALRSKVPMAVVKLLHAVCANGTDIETVKNEPAAAEWFAANGHRITVVSSF